MHVLLRADSFILTGLKDLPEDLQKWVLEEEKPEIIRYELKLDRNSYSQGEFEFIMEYNSKILEELLRRFLPKEVSTNVKSETLHDLKVLELDENQMKHKKIIAKIVLDVIISLKPQLNHIIIALKKSENLSKTILLRKQSIYDEKSEWDKYFLDFEYEHLLGEESLKKTIVSKI